MGKKLEWDYCGICPHFKNLIYFKDYDEFEKYPEGMTEICLCDFFIFPIQLTKEEYEKTPKWCPYDNW